MSARRWAREPVVHFVVLGGLLFGLDAAVGQPAPSEPAPVGVTAAERRLVLGPDVQAAVAERWRTAHGRAPSDAELQRELDAWRDQEILYQEGLRLGLDRGDPAVRDRVAGKMAQALGDGVVVPEPTEDELRAWFARHPDRWSRPARIDFTHVFVAGADAAARARAEELRGRLANGAEPARLGDTFQGGRRYRARRLEDLAETFGDGFVAAVTGDATADADTWRLAPSRFGWHVVRIDRRTAAEAPAFEAVRDHVLKDWKDERRRALQATAMDELRARWTVESP